MKHRKHCVAISSVPAAGQDDNLEQKYESLTNIVYDLAYVGRQADWGKIHPIDDDNNNN